jgi:predicted DNA-binding transcriptional regulator AlpA
MSPKTTEQSLGNSKKSKTFEKKYISVSELAARWSVSESAIYHSKCGSNALTPIRFGRSLRFLRTEVEALEKTRQDQTPDNKQLAAA